MSWNYRVCKIIEKSDYLDEPIVSYGIFEVYYDADYKIVSITEKPKVIAEDVEELRWTLKQMMYSCDKPVIDYNAETEKNHHG